MQRSLIPELLDSDSGTADEIAASLSDLCRINQCFVGIATTRFLIRQVVSRTDTQKLSLLEIASGGGQVPREARNQLKRAGVQVEVTLLDRASSHLKTRGNEVRAVAGDARALPFADASFDLVSCCLFAHHLTSEELLVFVNEGLRVCRIAVLINDLIRHPLHLGLVYAGLPLYRGRLTRYDAPASVRAAYTPQEMIRILQRTNASNVSLSRHYLFRIGSVETMTELNKR
jgi:ubiquinone/menaquinone biosynthesis C-methylase UbiE